MERSLQEILQAYNDESPLEEAYTIPAPWYVDERIAALERQYVFGGTWQVVAGVEQLKRAGQFVTRELAGEPIVVVRASDGELQAFYNVCRHHAAAVVSARAIACMRWAVSAVTRRRRSFRVSERAVQSWRLRLPRR